MFGDVNLQEDQINEGMYGEVDSGSPGDGGWPTIRTYSKENGGYKGEFAGDWKESNNLDGAMCDVFGKEDTMQEYVEEMGGVMMCADIACLCARKEAGECAKKELDYAAKFADEGLDVIQSRLKLLSASLAKSAKKDEWMSQRIAILKLLAATHPAATKDEL